MAILGDLLVQGSSRFLQHIYASSLTISDDFAATGDLSVGGAATIAGTLTLTKTQDLSGTANSGPALIIGGPVTGVHMEIDANEIQAKKTGTTTDILYLNHDGGEVQISKSGVATKILGTLTTSGAATFSSTTTFTGASTHSGNLTVNGTTSLKGTGIGGTLNVSGLTTIQNSLIVEEEIRSPKWIIDNIANLGGEFVVAPTIVCTEPTVNIDGTTITVTDSSITGAEFAGTTWINGSIVKVSGTLKSSAKDVVLTSINGTMTRELNATTTHTIQFTVPSGTDLPANGNYSGANVKNLHIMLYKRGGTAPVGIFMTSYGNTKKPYIEVYDGTLETDQTFYTPKVRLGHLANLKNSAGTDVTINGLTPTGWGLYTNNGYFDGVVVSKEGNIGGWTIDDDALYKGTNSLTSTTKGLFLGTNGIRNYESSTQYVNITAGKITALGVDLSGAITASSGAIGGFAIDSTSIHTKNVAITSNADNSIGFSSADFTRTINSTSRAGLRLAIGDKFGVTGDGAIFASSATVSGTITATAGAIGGFAIDSTSIHTNSVAVTSNADNSVALSSADFTRTINGTSRAGLRFAIGDKFGVTGDGAIFASNANISGTVTASAGNIGGFTIGTSSIYKTQTSYNGGTAGVYIGTDGIGLGAGKFYVTSAGALTATSATITGTINATNGYIGSSATAGWDIDSNSIKHGTLGSSGGYILNAAGNTSASINGTTRSNLALAIGSKFGVDNDGNLYANGANITNITIGNTDLEVGGRNLLGNTGNSKVTILANSVASATFRSIGNYNDAVTLYSFIDYDGYSNAISVGSSTSTGNRGVTWYTKPGEIIAGQKYTFSCKIKCSVATNVHMHTAWRNGSATATYTGWTAEGTKAISADTWTDYVCTFTPNVNANLNYEFLVAVCITGVSGGATYQVAHAKLEKGNIATAWTPAPEDFNQDIVNAVNGGGKNLLKKDYTAFNQTAYLVYNIPTIVSLTEIGEGTILTFQAWGVVPDNNSSGIYVYWGGGSINLFNKMLPDENGYICQTVTITSSQASHSHASNKFIHIYNFVSGHSGMNLTIDHWKLEQGSVPTPWSPTPEDVDYAITHIDGGNITTGNIAAARIQTNLISAINAQVSDLSALTATIGGFDIDASSIHTSGVDVTSNAENSIALSSTDFTRTLNGTAQTLRFAMGSNFGVTKTGTMFASKGYIGKYEITGTYLKTGSGTTATGIGGNQAFWAGADSSSSAPFRVAYDGTMVATSATLSGTIYATDGYIGSSESDGWAINSNAIQHGTVGSEGGYILNAAGNTTASINSTSRSNLALAIGNKFAVGKDGTLYANGANITGIDASNITTGTLSASRIAVSGITSIGASNGRHLNLTSSGFEVLNNTTKYLVVSENSITKNYTSAGAQLTVEGCYVLYDAGTGNGSNGTVNLSKAPSLFNYLKIEYTLNGTKKTGTEYSPVKSVEVFGSCSYFVLDGAYQADSSNGIIQLRCNTYSKSGAVLTLSHYMYVNLHSGGHTPAINSNIYITRVIGYF